MQSVNVHPRFVVDEAGRQVAVQLTTEEFRPLVLAAYEARRLGEGDAASLLGMSRLEFYAFAEASGISTCSYTQESLEDELAHL